MTESPEATAARSHLVDLIVQAMREQQADRPCSAVIDRRDQRILAVGAGPPGTHIAWEEALRDPERFGPIPGRDRIETMEHIEAFIDDEYAPADTAIYRQAFDAFQDAATPADWRHLLGYDHDAVRAFDVYVRDFHIVIARLLMHGSRRPRVGMLGTDRIARLAGDAS
ncbi:MAG: hypothetical protein J0M02_00035 [Planctomycetes bacterium]|nr:hypothetical protein [Planctomycetota bacterium]